MRNFKKLAGSAGFGRYFDTDGFLGVGTFGGHAIQPNELIKVGNRR